MVWYSLNYKSLGATSLKEMVLSPCTCYLEQILWYNGHTANVTDFSGSGDPNTSINYKLEFYNRTRYNIAWITDNSRREN